MENEEHKNSKLKNYVFACIVSPYYVLYVMISCSQLNSLQTYNTFKVITK